MEDIIQSLQNIGKLKELNRAGWDLKKVPNPESVADHSFRVTFMALLLADKFNVDKNKCIKLALVHDVCESITGDITPHDNITTEEKNRLEKEAMELLFKDIDSQMISLWEEYNNKQTPEAIFVSEMDKIETILQALEYEHKYKDEIMDLTEFWTYTEKRIKNPKSIELFNRLKSKR